MAAEQTTVYILLVIMAFAFSLLSVQRAISNMNKRVVVDWVNPIVSAIAFIMWLILAPIHLGYMSTLFSTTPPTEPVGIFVSAPAILYFAFAIIFLLFAIYGVFQNLSGSTQIKNQIEEI